MSSKQLLDLRNELDKNAHQAEAALIALCVDDHFANLDQDALAGMLWLAAERVEKLRQDLQRINQVLPLAPARPCTCAPLASA